MLEVFGELLTTPVLREAFGTQRRVLREFHARSAGILEGVCALKPYSASEQAIERNLFSTLFLAAERCAGLPLERMDFYGLVNQCMRAWVTGCDNLLDDEYKSVIPFDLSDDGLRSRSVLMIMTADRVFTDLIIEELSAGRLCAEQASALSSSSLRALAPSALQEHQEEAGAPSILSAQSLLDTVHVPKTGLLFEAPVTLPEAMGEISADAAETAKAGLRAFGLACQIFDDIVDFDDDIANRGHNVLLSLAVHGSDAEGVWPLKHEDVDMGDLPLDAAGCEACDWSLRLFAEARESCDRLGLRLSDGAWRAIIVGIAILLRLPGEHRKRLEDKL